MLYKKKFLFFLALPLFFLGIDLSFKDMGKINAISIINLTSAQPDQHPDIYQAWLTNSIQKAEELDQSTKSSNNRLTVPPAKTTNNNNLCKEYDKNPSDFKDNNRLKKHILTIQREIDQLKSQTVIERYKKAGKKFERQKPEKLEKISDCQKLKDYFESFLGDRDKCEEKWKEARQARKEFSKDCGQFLGGAFECSKAIEACNKCPDPDEEEHDGIDCVKIHKKTKCPSKSEKELKAAKEKRDKVTEETKELKDKIKELEEDIVSKENDLNKELAELEAEFTKTRRELERKTEEQKEELESDLKKSKAKISSAVSEQISKIQAEIDNFLKIAHAFENAITKANMEYRKERRQIVMECEVQAQGRLAAYKKKRRAAIQTGSLQISLSNLLYKGRTSFAQKDVWRLQQYNTQCLKKRKEDFQEVEQIHKQNLRVIEQQKEQYQAKLKKMKDSVNSLNGQAVKEQSKLIQEYATQMSKILASYQKEFIAANQSYIKAKKSLLAQAKAITVLDKHLSQQKQLLQEKRLALVHEQELISYLKSKGVTEDMDDEFSSANSSYAEYSGAVDIAEEACSCAKSKPKRKKNQK